MSPRPVFLSFLLLQPAGSCETHWAAATPSVAILSHFAQKLNAAPSHSSKRGKLSQKLAPTQCYHGLRPCREHRSPGLAAPRQPLTCSVYQKVSVKELVVSLTG